ncbi:MAG: hypothetical protein P6H82_01515 [Candidatus Arsenophonus melophagi]|nr:hypothetical protein [Candidatus Arsenophonus melophagi]
MTFNNVYYSYLIDRIYGFWLSKSKEYISCSDYFHSQAIFLVKIKTKLMIFQKKDFTVLRDALCDTGIEILKITQNCYCT